MKLQSLGMVTAPGSSTHLDLYLIDRGNGREVVYTCYIEAVIEERITQGLITPHSVPEEMRDEEIPYHPEVWAK